jgi:hypothetical protein
MGQSRLSKRILIVWVEKGKRNFAKILFFVGLAASTGKLRMSLTGGETPTNQEAYNHYAIISKNGKGRIRRDCKKTMGLAESV